MKIVQINAVCGAGSTGKICSAVAELLDQNHIENYIFYASGNSADPHGKKFLSKWSIKWQALCSRVLGNYGFNTHSATRRLLRELDAIAPDIVHLHNLHGHNVNLTSLFCYFKKHPEIQLFWTFHDCWAFTAYCTNFTLEKCGKWMTCCHDCPQCKRYSWFFDRSKTLYQRKKELFLGQNMTIITPSQWLAGLVKQSFLKEYPVKVINNGINLSVFRPSESDFRTRYGISKDAYVLLGVAFNWEMRKGLDVFVELARQLPEDYRIVLVGTDKKVDRQLPDNIISIHRTKTQTELAEIYSAADLFVNPTREENYPTVNMEAVACGTPVVTFRTGGSPETIDKHCGRVVDCDDIRGLIHCIEDIRHNHRLDTAGCLKRAAECDAHDRFAEYITLYNVMDGR